MLSGTYYHPFVYLYNLYKLSFNHTMLDITPTPTTLITTTPTHDLFKEFMHGIKRDNSTFPKFKDEK